jgi:transcriptional regulator with XRE-family HTH domain
MRRESVMAVNAKALKVVGNQAAIGKAVKEARMASGISMTDFAKKVGVSQAQISRLEDGQQGFRTATMQKIAEALGLVVVIYFGPKSAVASMAGKD